ncbi:MAG: hypothetical protein IKV55_06550 [Oscillospiraceae bacterium]|nr:hypothetical protein [Oscillospiraceae bacterium]
MNQNRINHTAVKTFSVSAPQLWALLTDFGCDALYTDGMRAALAPVGENSFDGMLSINGTAFDASYTPYDIRLTHADMRLGLRIQPAPDGCTVMLVSTAAENAPLQVDDGVLQRFLQQLAALCENGKESPAAQLPETEEPAAPKAPAPAAKRRPRTGRILVAALLILALCAGAVAVLLTRDKAPAGKPAYTPTQTTEIAGGSSKVTMDAALGLTAGMSRSEVEAVLGKPADTAGDTALYISSLPNAYGDAAVQVQVVYENKVAQRISALDLDAATAIGAVQAAALSPDMGSDSAAFAAQAGCDVSLYRSYLAEDGSAVTEYHFGYMDPKANFSALWQGELWARVAADGSVQTDRGFSFGGSGYRYNGSDPLFCSSLAGHPFAMQYSSFDDYLADFEVYRLCMEVMDIHYSRGDLNAILGGMTEAALFDDITLYQAVSAATLADGVTPAWAFTAGTNTRGEFALLSAVNMRLWQQPSALSQRDLGAIDIGTGYTELLQTIGLMPSSIYIDRSYLVLGFGSYNAESTTQFEQFEYMVQLQQNDLTVSKVYNNTDMQLVID